MRDFGHVTVPKFGPIEERSVQEREIDCRHLGLQALLPLRPFVDVRNEQGRPIRPLDPIADRLGKLIAVRYKNGRDLELRPHCSTPIGLEGMQLDISQVDQLTPRAIFPQEFAHPGHRIHRDVIGTQGLPSQGTETRIMSPMRMRQKNTVGHASRGAIHLPEKKGLTG